jgi:hypothetical protein
MKKTTLIALLAVVLMHVSARPASAQSGIIRWIAKLSGPGGFVGPGYEFFPLCYGTRNGVSRLRPVNSEVIGTKAFDTDLNCRGFQRDGRLLMGGFQVAYMTGANNQQYDASVPESFTDRVEALLVMGTADMGVGHPAFDVGVGAGFVRFFGMPAAPFNQPIYHVRLTVKPMALKPKPAPVYRQGDDAAYTQAVLDRYQDDLLQLRLEMNVMPGGLSDEDFGAIPGTFPSTSTEVTLRGTIAINLGNLFKW